LSVIKWLKHQSVKVNMIKITNTMKNVNQSLVVKQ